MLFEQIVRLGSNLKSLQIIHLNVPQKRELLTFFAINISNLVELRIQNFVMAEELQSIVYRNPSLELIDVQNIISKKISVSFTELRQLTCLKIVQENETLLDLSLPFKSQRIREILLKGKLTTETVKEVVKFRRIKHIEELVIG